MCLQGSFQKLIKGLQSLDYSILDVNSHRWHDDYNKFKAGIKDLEVMLTNVIQLGFDNASSLVGRVELLEVPLHPERLDIPSLLAAKSCMLLSHGIITPFGLQVSVQNLLQPLPWVACCQAQQVQEAL